MPDIPVDDDTPYPAGLVIAGEDVDDTDPADDDLRKDCCHD